MDQAIEGFGRVLRARGAKVGLLVEVRVHGTSSRLLHHEAVGSDVKLPAMDQQGRLHVLLQDPACLWVAGREVRTDRGGTVVNANAGAAIREAAGLDQPHPLPALRGDGLERRFPSRELRLL